MHMGRSHTRSFATSSTAKSIPRLAHRGMMRADTKSSSVAAALVHFDAQKWRSPATLVSTSDQASVKHSSACERTASISLAEASQLQVQLKEAQDQLKAAKMECNCLQANLAAAGYLNAALRHTNFKLEQDLRDERRLRIELRLRIEKLKPTSPRGSSDINFDPAIERAAMKVVKSAELQLLESELVALRHEVIMLRSEAISSADDYLSKNTWTQFTTLA